MDLHLSLVMFFGYSRWLGYYAAMRTVLYLVIYLVSWDLYVCHLYIVISHHGDYHLCVVVSSLVMMSIFYYMLVI